MGITPDGIGILKNSSFHFSAGETQVRLNTIPKLEKVIVNADIHDSGSFVELLLTLDALCRLPITCEIELILPYLPYSRQDRACVEGEAFSLSVFVKALAPYLSVSDKVITWDAHSPVASSLFREEGCTLFNVKPDSLLRDFCRGGARFPSDTIVIAPDKGAVERATLAQKELGLSSVVYATKVRNPENGQILRTDVPTEVSYAGKPLLIVDDICDGGRTFVELAKVLRKHNPSRIDLYVTHGIFSKSFEVFDNLIDTFYVANLLPNNSFYDAIPQNVSYLRSAA